MRAPTAAIIAIAFDTFQQQQRHRDKNSAFQAAPVLYSDRYVRRGTQQSVSVKSIDLSMSRWVEGSAFAKACDVGCCSQQS
eukprot:1245954-Rhodomonas_salina.2